MRYIPGDQAVAEEVAEAVAEGIGGGDSLLFAPAEARARAAAVLREAVDHSRPTILASEGALVGEVLPERVAAHALTIHKSVGSNLHAAVVDLSSSCFAHGQLYMALSRVPSLEHKLNI